MYSQFMMYGQKNIKSYSLHYISGCHTVRAAVPNLCVAVFQGRAWGHSKSSAILHGFAVNLASPAIAQFLPLSFAISIICVKWQSTNCTVFIQVLSFF